MGIGKRIKEARENAGLTQKELAEKIGVTGSAITNYEQDTSHPKENILYSLINVLNVDANFLFQDMMNSELLDFTVKPHEKDLLQKYRRLPDTGKQAVENMMDTMLGAQPEPQDRIVPIQSQERMTPVVAAAFGDDGSAPQMRMVSEDDEVKAAMAMDALMAEKAEAEREREESAARMRTYLAREDKRKKKR